MKGERYLEWSGKKGHHITSYSSQNINVRKFIPSVESVYLSSKLETHPEGWEQIMADLEKIIIPGLIHWSGNNNPDDTEYPHVLTNLYSGTVTTFVFICTAWPIIAELETMMMDWLADALALPKQFFSTRNPLGRSRGGGCFVTSDSDGHSCTIKAAKKKAIEYLRQDGHLRPDEDDHLLIRQLVGYMSTEADYAIEKGLSMSSLILRVIPVDQRTLAMRVDILEKQMHDDVKRGLHPTFVAVTAGTRGSNAFDDIIEVAKVAALFPACWVHCDASYIGNLLVCPEYRYLVPGLEFVDSFLFNPNKLLVVNFDTSCLFLKDMKQYAEGLVIGTDFRPIEQFDFRNYGVQLGRKFRALKTWLKIRVNGVPILQFHVRSHIKRARILAEKLKIDSRLEVLDKIKGGLVIFRCRDGNHIPTRKLMTRVNESRILLLTLTPIILQKKLYLRYSDNYAHSNEEITDCAHNLIIKCLDELDEEFLEFNDNKRVNQLLKKYSKITLLPATKCGGNHLCIHNSLESINLRTKNKLKKLWARIK